MQNTLWISNLAPEVSDNDLRALLEKYAHGIECLAIKRVEGDGSRPGAMLTLKVNAVDDTMHISSRLNGMFWHGRTLSCSTMH